LQFLERQFKRRWKDNETNLPEQEKALAAFIQPFLKAREERTIDQNRWSKVISTLAIATGLPEGELHRRYGKVARAKMGRAQAAGSGEPTNITPVRRPLLRAQDQAERQILGLLLLESARWHGV